jgi:hypothetical protein
METEDINPKEPGSTAQTAADSAKARADSTDRDAVRQSRSLVRDLPVGKPRPANGKQYD